MERLRTAVIGVILLVASLAMTIIAVPAEAATPSVAPQITAGAIVASGPGFVIVGSGSRIANTGPAAIVATRNKLAPLSVTNCGWVTCSLYLSRRQTNWLNYNIAVAGGVYAAAGAFCGAAALISGIGAIFVGIGCAAVWAIYGGFLVNALTHAASSNGCLRIRYGLGGLAFYNDHSTYCHNT